MWCNIGWDEFTKRMQDFIRDPENSPCPRCNSGRDMLAVQKPREGERSFYVEYTCTHCGLNWEVAFDATRTVLIADYDNGATVTAATKYRWKQNRPKEFQFLVEEDNDTVEGHMRHVELPRLDGITSYLDMKHEFLDAVRQLKPDQRYEILQAVQSLILGDLWLYISREAEAAKKEPANGTTRAPSAS